VAGELQANNTLRSPTVRGQLRVLPSRLNLAALRLRNVQGTLDVDYDAANAELQAGQLPVRVNLTGETTIRVQRSAVGEADDFDLNVEITGRPGAGSQQETQLTEGARSLEVGGAGGGLKVRVSSEDQLPPGGPKALLEAQLGVGGSGSSIVQQLPGLVQQALATSAAGELTGRIEEVIQSSLGLNVFSIDLGLGQSVRVRIGKRLYDRLYGVLVQEFGSGSSGQVPQRKMDLYYRVTPSFRVGIRREEKPINENSIFISGGFTFR